MNRFRAGRPSPSLVISIVALVVAMAGTGYAAIALPKNSVGSKQLKRGAVTPSKVARSTIRRFRGARGLPGAAGAAGATGPQGIQGPAGQSVGPGPGSVTPSMFGTMPAARVTRTTNQTLSSGSNSAIAFTNEDYDNSDMHSTAPASYTQLFAPVSGVYAISAGARYAPNVTGQRETTIFGGGAILAEDVRSAATNASYPTSVSLAAQTHLDAGEWVSLRVSQSSGGPLDVWSTPHLEMVWVGP